MKSRFSSNLATLSVGKRSAKWVSTVTPCWRPMSATALNLPGGTGEVAMISRFSARALPAIDRAAMLAKAKRPRMESREIRRVMAGGVSGWLEGEGRSMERGLWRAGWQRIVGDGQVQLRPFAFQALADLLDQRRQLVVRVGLQQGQFLADERRLLRTAEAGEAGHQVEQRGEQGRGVGQTG